MATSSSIIPGGGLGDVESSAALADLPLAQRRSERPRTIGKLTAADIMRRSLIVARPNQSLADAERTLIQGHVGGLPVVEGGRLMGVLSRSDIARVRVLTGELDGQVTDHNAWDMNADGFQHGSRAEFAGFRHNTDSLKVKDAMRTQVVTCTPQTAVKDLASAMIRNHVHRVIVVEGDRPVGIISSLDVVELVAGLQE